MASTLRPLRLLRMLTGLIKKVILFIGCQHISQGGDLGGGVDTGSLADRSDFQLALLLHYFNLTL